MDHLVPERTRTQQIAYTRKLSSMHTGCQGVSHTPLRGVNTPPSFARHPPPASGGNEGERGRGGRGQGIGEEKGRDPQGLVDTPMFQILKNTLQAVLFGVPLGSVLGPLLYVLYTAELFHIVARHRLRLYM